MRCNQIIIILLLFFTSCQCQLRGKSKNSKDNLTYLVIEDDNGGQCGSMIVDGKLWPQKIGEPGLIEPGIHSIRCGTIQNGILESDITFEIKKGTTYYFNYWGP